MKDKNLVINFDGWPLKTVNVRKPHILKTILLIIISIFYHK
jgi:hypothetical protein